MYLICFESIASERYLVLAARSALEALDYARMQARIGETVYLA